MKFMESIKKGLQELADKDFGKGVVNINISSKKELNGTDASILCFGYKGSSTTGCINVSSVEEDVKRLGFDYDTVLNVFYEEVLKHLERTSPNQKDDMTALLTDYNYVRKNLFVQLVSVAGNKELLESIPWVPVLDLAVIFRISVTVNGQRASVVINNSIFKTYGISKERLYEDAMKSEFNLYQPRFQNISSFLTGFPDVLMDMPEEDAPVFGSPFSGPNVPMFTGYLADHFGMNAPYGACCILSKDYLEEVSRVLGGGDFIVLPSSIHDVIMIPTDIGAEIGDLATLVTEINGSDVVADNEVLSNSVYYYSKEKGCLDIYAHPVA